MLLPVVGCVLRGKIAAHGATQQDFHSRAQIVKDFSFLATVCQSFRGLRKGVGHYSVDDTTFEISFFGLDWYDLSGCRVNDADLLLSNVDVELTLGMLVRDATKDAGDIGCRIGTLIAILDKSFSLLLSQTFLDSNSVENEAHVRTFS